MSKVHKETYILSCYQEHVQRTWYVAQRPGQGGKGSDWGWEEEIGKAVPQSWYWTRRFMKDQRSLGYSPQAVETRRLIAGIAAVGAIGDCLAGG